MTINAKKTAAAVLLSLMCFSPLAAAESAPPAADVQTAGHAEQMTAAGHVVLSWPDIPGAVYYELVLIDGDTGKSVLKKFDIYATGCEISAEQADFSKRLFWQVRGLNIDKVPVSDYTEAKPLAASLVPFKANSTLRNARGFSIRNYHVYAADKSAAVRPLQLTTDFGEMAYMPVYPVYSWIPVQNAANYIISVYKASDETQPISWNKVKSGVIDFYDTRAYTEPGEYFFEIAAYDDAARKIAQSQRSYFTVDSHVPVAALGDSITHGGGVVDTPPSSTLYNWETYSAVPVLNIGFSGNLTSDMLKRFERDVLPFSPKVLVIMGGINDVRTGVSAQTVIANLSAIRDKCKAHDIIPVFLTMTSVNPPKMKKVINLDIAPSWQAERTKVNDWIKTQDYYVDVNDEMMSDSRGYLPDNMTTDGLHPDYEGKKHIGETAGDYIRLNFPYALDDM